MLQKLLWKISTPLEVKATIDEITTFLSEHASLSKQILERDALKLAKDAEKTIYSIRIEHMKPDQLALLLITNVTGKHLSLGNQHTYRGVLSALGHEMLAVFTKAVQIMLERGYHTKEEADEDMQWIHRQIASVG